MHPAKQPHSKQQQPTSSKYGYQYSHNGSHGNNYRRIRSFRQAGGQSKRTTGTGRNTVAKKYKETEYTVPDYKNLDIEFQIPAKTDDPPKLPPSIQQHYDQLLQYATESALTYNLKTRLLDVPLRLAIHGKSPVSPQQLELHADPVLKVKGIMEIDYKMNIQLDLTKEQLPLEGTMQLQQIDGQWKVIHDAYDSTDRGNLANRLMADSSK
ncbi:hypothetical protein [Paenibacillus sp. Z6-24]